jgi:integrase
MKTKGAQVDAFSPVMNDCGDKLVTTQEPAVCGKSKKRKHGKPVASVKFGSAVVPIYQLASASRKRFILSFYMEGKRERRSFTNLETAKKEAQLVAQRIQGGRQEMNDLRPHDREAYRTVVDLLMPSGVPLVTAVQEYVRANKLLNGLPLLTAVDEFSRKARGMKLGVKVKDVVLELLVAKKQDGLSHRYQLQLQSNLRRFAADFDVPISHIRRDQIDDWLRKRGVAIRSRNGLLATIRVLFSFAKKRAYLPVGDVTEAEALDKIRAGDVETQIFTPEQFAKILHAAPPNLIPILAIGGFAGMRKAEMDRLDWNAVDLERKMIEVRAGQAKTASRRIIPISDNLLAWLKPLMREGKIVKDNDFHRQITALAGTLKIDWPNNVLRHSFISYRIAIVQSADQVALEAGNSPSIIFKHYRELTTEEQAEKWFGILPKEGQWENTFRYDRRTRTVTLPDSELS